MFTNIFFNPFPNKPKGFLRVCNVSLLKTLREKEKLLATSNFSFSHSVFYLFGEHSAIFIKLKIVVCKLFQFGIVLNLSFAKGLTMKFYKAFFFKDVKINPLPNDKFFDWSKLKELGDNKINITEKLKFILERVENIVGKGENAGNQHFLLFLKCF